MVCKISATGRYSSLFAICEGAGSRHRTSLATETFRKAIAIDPKNAIALRGYGRALIGLDRPAQAIEQYEIARAANPGDIDAINGLGVALNLAGRHEQAERRYTEGLAIAPESLLLRNNLALSLAFGGKYGPAIEILKKVTADPGASVRNRQNLALIYGLSGQTARAAEIARIDLNEAQVRNNLAYYERLRRLAGKGRAKAILKGETPKAPVQPAGPVAQPSPPAPPPPPPKPAIAAKPARTAIQAPGRKPPPPQPPAQQPPAQQLPEAKTPPEAPPNPQAAAAAISQPPEPAVMAVPLPVFDVQLASVRGESAARAGATGAAPPSAARRTQAHRHAHRAFRHQRVSSGAGRAASGSCGGAPIVPGPCQAESRLPDRTAARQDRGLTDRPRRWRYSPSSSLSPLHFPGHGWADIPFTYLDKAGQRATKGGGIAIAEIYFLEVLFEDFHPTNIFVIGNAFGWSTVALALLNPDAKVVAIDACPRPEEEAGIHFTNQLAQDFGLNLVAVKAKSPEDVAATAVAHLDGGIDFAFIDGGHTNQQQSADFGALKDVAVEDCAYLFHDVVNFFAARELYRNHPGQSAAAGPHPVPHAFRHGHRLSAATAAADRPGDPRIFRG